MQLSGEWKENGAAAATGKQDWGRGKIPSSAQSRFRVRMGRVQIAEGIKVLQALQGFAMETGCPASTLGNPKRFPALCTKLKL